MDSPLALDIDDLVKRYATGTEALRGRVARHPGRRVLRAARPQRRRQVDPDPLRHRPRPADLAGAIRVFGHDAISDYGEARLAVGLAPQELNLDWFLTVAETLDYHAGYFGMPRRERRERADELLEIFSLADKRDERTTARCRAA